jgi:putative membrane protein
MISGHTKSWLGIVFSIKGSALPVIWKRVLVTTVISVVVTIFWQSLGLSKWSLTPTPFSLIGLALAIFLGFRNTTSYDRFWEGRKLWGRVVNLSRIWARQVCTLVSAPPDAPELDRVEVAALQKELVYRQIAYVHSLRLHLRQSADWHELDAFIDERERKLLQRELNVPAALLHKTGELLTDAWHRGWIHADHVRAPENTLTQLTEVQGGCERIRATPIPFGYTVLMHRIVGVYCVTLSFGIEETVGILTPAVVALVSYAFYGLDAIGDEIEEPFGFDANDLPLNQLSRMIEINLRQRVDGQGMILPKVWKAKNGIMD